MEQIAEFIILNNKWTTGDVDAICLHRVVRYQSFVDDGKTSVEQHGDVLHEYAAIHPPELRNFFSTYLHAHYFPPIRPAVNNTKSFIDEMLNLVFKASVAPPDLFNCGNIMPTVRNRCDDLSIMMKRIMWLHSSCEKFRFLVTMFSSLDVSKNEDTHQLRLMVSLVFGPQACYLLELNQGEVQRYLTLTPATFLHLMRNVISVPDMAEREELVRIVAYTITSRQSVETTKRLLVAYKQFERQERRELDRFLQDGGFYRLFLHQSAIPDLCTVLDFLFGIEPKERLAILAELNDHFYFSPTEMVGVILFLDSFTDEKRVLITSKIRELIIHTISGYFTSVLMPRETFITLFQLFDKWMFKEKKIDGGELINMIRTLVIRVKFTPPEILVMAQIVDTVIANYTVTMAENPTLTDMQTFFEATMEWVHAGMTSADIAVLMKAFGALPYDPKYLCRTFVPLLKTIVAPPFCFAIDGRDLIGNLACIPTFQHQHQIVTHIQALAETLGFISTPKLATLVKALHKTPPEERDCIMSIVVQCGGYVCNEVYQNLGIDDLCSIITTLRFVAVSDRESLFASIRPYLEPAMASSTDIAVVMGSFRLIPRCFRERFTSHVLPFIRRPRMTGYEMTSVINAFRLCVSQAMSICNADVLGGEDIYDFVDAEITNVAETTWMFLRDFNGIAMTKVSGHTIAAIVDSVRLIHEREDRLVIAKTIVYETLCPLLQKCNWCLRGVEEEEAGAAEAGAGAGAAEAGAGADDAEWKWVGWCCEEDANSNVSHLIQVFNQMPKEDWTNVLQCVIPFVTPTMKARHVADLVDCIQRIPVAERFVHAARTLLYQSSIPTLSTIDYFDLPLNQPVTVPEGRIIEARRLFDVNFDLEWEVEEGWPDLFEAILGDGGVGVGAGADVAVARRQYVNVHEGSRESLTDEAIVRLIDICSDGCVTALPPGFTPIREENVVFEDFWQAVLRVEPETRREQILRTLGVNADMTHKHRSERDFGGLLTSDDCCVTVGPERRVPARALLAYFWHFANTFVDGTITDEKMQEIERGNIRLGIMDALFSSVQKSEDGDDSHVVCDMGKLQRLVVSTLQGRLVLENGDVVDIDNVSRRRKRKRGAGADARAGAEETPLRVFMENIKAVQRYFIKPFLDEMGCKSQETRPKSANDFLREYIEYYNRHEHEVVLVRGQAEKRLDAKAVMYFLFMMESTPWKYNLEGSVWSLLSESLFVEGDVTTMMMKRAVIDFDAQFGAFGRMVDWAE